jgi:hypothetical protein
MPRVRVVKVPYVSDKATKDGLNTPSETDVSRLIRAEVDTWQPRRGPDWPDILMRMAASGPSLWVVYTAASAALVVILFSAFLVGSYFQVGALGSPPVESQVHH